MGDEERKKRVTIPAVLQGKPVRILVAEYPAEDLGEKVAYLRWLRVQAPDQTATVIARNQPPMEVKLEDLDKVG